MLTHLNLLIVFFFFVSFITVQVNCYPYEESEYPRNPVPYHAAVIVKGQVTSAMCSAAIIHPQWVVTSAHCVENLEDRKNYLPLEKIQVVVGVTSVRELVQAAKEHSPRQMYSLESMTVHPSYSSSTKVSRSNSFWVYDDIVLLKTTRPMFRSGDREIQAISLPASQGRPSVGMTVRASGFNKRRSEDPESGTLRLSRTEILDDYCCKSDYSAFQPNEMMCTAGRSLNICPGDLGGPLVFCDPIQGCVLVGISIFGPDCGSSRPNYYLSVTSYVGWMIGVMKNNPTPTTSVEITKPTTTTQPFEPATQKTTPRSTTTTEPTTTLKPTTTTRYTTTTMPTTTSRLTTTTELSTTTTRAKTTTEPSTTTRLTSTTEPTTIRPTTTTGLPTTTLLMMTTEPPMTTRPKTTTEPEATTEGVTKISRDITTQKSRTRPDELNDDRK